MKKKLLIFLTVFILIPRVIAETEVVGTTTEKCTEPSNGKVQIKWTTDKKSVAKTSVYRCEGKVDKEAYSGYSFKKETAKEKCKKSWETNCYSKTETDKSSGGSNCTSCSITENKKQTKNCQEYHGSSCPTGTTQEGEEGENWVYCCAPGEEVLIGYKWSYTKTTVTVDADCKWKVGEVSVDAAKYIIESRYTESGKLETAGADTAYCLQPGNKGPITSQDYKLDTSFNVADCKDSLHRKDGSKDVRCGLAHILYETVTYDETTNTYKDNGKYNYGSITYALRMWMSEYAKEYGTFGLGSEESWNTEFDALEWVSKDNYYKKTADALIDGTYEDKVEQIKKLDKNKKIADKYIGILYCPTNNKNCDIKKSIELFLSAYKAVFVDTSTFLKGVEFNEEVPVVRNYQSSKTEIKTIVEIPESIQQNRTCSEEDYKNGKCYVKVKYFDEDGNDITDKVEAKGSCGKEFCTITTEIVNLCKEEKVSITTKVYIDGWERNAGYIRFYTHATNPKNYQKMITFAFYLEKCDKPGSEITTVPIEPVCECPPSTCEDLNIVTNMPSKCSSDEYTTGTSKDPSMSCIINACQEFDKEKFNDTQKLNANPQVCKVYCRNEVELILPGQVSTYAGMQFQFDLGSVLKNAGKTVIANDRLPVHKITGVLNHKYQCTSEINNEAWKQKYDALITYDNKQELSKLIYDLLNCNLYTKDEITKYFNTNKLTAITIKDTVKDLATRNELNSDENSGVQLNVSYEKELLLGKISGLINSGNTKTYYCTNNCYNYEKNKNAEITGNNSLENIKYNNSTIKLPNNAYASFTIESQTDFYQQKEYQTNVISGVVSEVDGNNNDKNKTPIPSYSYPVSNNTKTGTYDINYKLTNAPLTEKTEVNYSCKYDVYNRTVLYDCKITDNNGNIDLSNCSDDCYEIRNGIPIINKSCIKWTKTDSKQYGFIYRSVDLSNLFPNGLASRSKPINWSNKLKEIDDIQKTASNIFTNNNYLEYRYVLTPETIKEIKKYNKDQSTNGGYTNNTLVGCELVSNGSVYEFKNCKSTFLTKEIKSYPGIEISGSKAGDN